MRLAFRVCTACTAIPVMMLWGVSLLNGRILVTNWRLALLSSMVFLLCMVLEINGRRLMVSGFRHTIAGRNRMNLTLVIVVLVCTFSLTLLLAVIAGPADVTKIRLTLLAVNIMAGVRTVLILLTRFLFTMRNAIFRAYFRLLRRRLRISVRLTIRKSRLILVISVCRTLVLAVLLLVRVTWLARRFFLWARVTLFLGAWLNLVF